MVKKSFVMYKDWGDAVKLMTDEQAGQLLKAIYLFQDGQEADDLDPGVKFVFELIKGRFKADAESYAEACKRKAENGRLGGLAKARNLANASKCQQELAKASKSWQDLANLADNDNDNVNDNDNECVFKPPSLKEVQSYCLLNGIRIDASSFIDYYSARGWMTGNAMMTDWQAAVRMWARREQPSKNRFHNFNERDNTGISQALLKKQLRKLADG